MASMDDSEVLELAAVPEAVSLAGRIARWTWGVVMARPEFIGCQQRFGGINPGQSEWAINIRVVGGVPGLGSLKHSTIRLIPCGFEEAGDWSARVKRDSEHWQRPLDLVWQKEPDGEYCQAQDLYKGRHYCAPIFVLMAASGNKPASVHLKTVKFFRTGGNELGAGNHYFKIELKSGSTPAWRSEDYFQIGVPKDIENGGQIALSLVPKEQFFSRFGERVAG